MQKSKVSIIDKIKVFSRNELVCMLALLIGLMYGMYYLDIMNPLEYSLSEMGRYNHALFILWSLSSGLALLLNVPRLYDRINYKSKLGKSFLYIGLIALVLTFLNMSKDPMYWYWIHVATAIIFSVFSFFSVAVALLYMFKKNAQYKALTIIFFILLLIDIVFLIIYEQMALFEFIPLLACYVVFCFTNFTKSFELEHAKDPAIKEAVVENLKK